MPYGQRVATKEGATQIGKIVNDEKQVDVLSYNEKENRYEYKPVTDFYKNGSTDKWLDIRHGGKKTKLVTTPNHEIYTPEGKKQAGDLREGDCILAGEPRLSGDFESLVIGSVIGDACVHNRDSSKRSHMSVCHGKDQHDYAKWKEKLMGEVVSSSRTYDSAYDENYPETTKYEYKTISASIFDELADRFYNEDGRFIPENLSLDAKSVAIWYMDDGSTNFSESQRPRATFHTQSYGKDSVEVLIRELEKLGISSKINEYGSGYVIEVGADETEKLFNMIAPYVPGCMSRKLPEKYMHVPTNWDREIEPYKSEIKKISEANPHNKMRYDIEVKDNHNYVTKNALVSNSNFRFTVEEFEGEHKFVFGSRRVVYKIDGEPDYEENVDGRFKDAIDYVRKNCDPERIADVYGTHYTFFAENMVQHSLDYNYDTNPPPQVIGFDVYDEVEEEYLSVEKAYSMLKSMDLETAPIVDRMKVEDFDPEEYEIPESNYRDGKMEGVVVINKGRQEDNRSGFSTRGKMVTDEFAEKHKKATGANQSKEAIHGHEKIVSKYCTDARIRKHIEKMRDSGRPMGMELMGSEGDSAGLPIRVSVDILEEEADEIVRRNDEMNWKNYRSLVADRCVHVLRQEMQKNV